MSQGPLVSVIIPVYNVEKYLSQCVDSVLSQTYSNLEIILIDDGSNDRCPAMCDEYAATDNRVKVIHKENSGQSDARNAGLDIATGDYITFIDSDDWAAPDMIEFLYRNIKKHNADISCSGFYHAYVNMNIPGHYFSLKQPLLLNGEKAAEKALTRQINIEAWAKLYAKHIFKTLRYPVGKIFEDAWIVVDICTAAAIFFIDPIPKYYYRQRQSSTMRSKAAAEVTAIKLEISRALQLKLEEKYPQFASIYKPALCKKYISAVNNILSGSICADTPEGCKLLTSIKTDISDILSNKIKRRNIPAGVMIKLRLININMRLYIIYYRLSKKCVRLFRPLRFLTQNGRENILYEKSKVRSEMIRFE